MEKNITNHILYAILSSLRYIDEFFGNLTQCNSFESLNDAASLARAKLSIHDKILQNNFKTVDATQLLKQEMSFILKSLKNIYELCENLTICNNFENFEKIISSTKKELDDSIKVLFINHSKSSKKIEKIIMEKQILTIKEIGAILESLRNIYELCKNLTKCNNFEDMKKIILINKENLNDNTGILLNRCLKLEKYVKYNF